MSWFKSIAQKLNPAQPSIAAASGETSSIVPNIKFERAFEKLEAVNRGVNMVVDAAAQFKIDVGEKESFPGIQTIRLKKLNNLLNRQPNPFQNADAFWRNMYLDMLMDGNSFA